MFIDIRLPYLREFKYGNMVMLEWFIKDIWNIAVRQEGFIINNRKPFKFIMFSNYHTSQGISKSTLPPRTEPLNFKHV